MQNKLLGLVLSLFVLAAYPSQAAWALMLTDSILFPGGPTAKDEHSGNGIVFSYSHSLSGLEGAELLSGRLKLTHSGNSDEGPRQELWSAFSGGNILLGKLGASDPGPITDEWVLPAPVLDELLNGGGLLGVDLSEQTPFNSEQIRLFRSDLEIEYKRPERIPVSVPEAGTAFLVGAGLLLAGTSRKLFVVLRRRSSV